MHIRIRHLWEIVTTGYWFVPAVMMTCATILAFGLLFVDRNLIESRSPGGWLYAGGPDGAKVLLSTVAGSVITVAGVVFSITIAALTQASGQFGPRLLRNFMRDTGNQVVLGTFVATFLYCLLILRTIHDQTQGGPQFVPNASISAAVLLSVASIVVLIYFIHHVSVSLQAPAVVASVLADLEEVLARLPKSQTGAGVTTADGPSLRDDWVASPAFQAASLAIAASPQGYVQAVNYEELMAAAESADLILRLEYRPGDYVIAGSTLLWAWPADRCPPDLAQRANGAFMCGRHATPEQDVEHAVRQIVEVAVRALSPGINDPFTAINCIDALGAGLCAIVRQGLPGPQLYDRHGRLRVVSPVTTFDGITNTAFNQIRQYGRNSVAVTIRLLEVIGKCAEQMTTPEQRQSLLRHAEMVYRQGEHAIPEPRDREDVRQRWEAVVQTLGEEPGRVDDRVPTPT